MADGWRGPGAWAGVHSTWLLAATDPGGPGCGGRQGPRCLVFRPGLQWACPSLIVLAEPPLMRLLSFCVGGTDRHREGDAGVWGGPACSGHPGGGASGISGAVPAVVLGAPGGTKSTHMPSEWLLKRGPPPANEETGSGIRLPGLRSLAGGLKLTSSLPSWENIINPVRKLGKETQTRGPG